MDEAQIPKNIGKVSVLLPAHNEAGNIAILMEKIHKTFLNCKLDGEVILINDGSTDETGKVAREFLKKYSFLSVYDHKKRLGLTETLMHGFMLAKGDILIFLCSDLQSDPEEDIPRLLAGIESGADVVVGWRQGRKDLRRFGSRIYNYASNSLFNITFHDQNWIKAFKKDFIDNLILKSDWHRLIIPIAVFKGYKVIEVKTGWNARSYGKSKYTFSRIPIAILDMLMLKIEMLFVRKSRKN